VGGKAFSLHPFFSRENVTVDSQGEKRRRLLKSATENRRGKRPLHKSISKFYRKPKASLVGKGGEEKEKGE